MIKTVHSMCYFGAVLYGRVFLNIQANIYNYMNYYYFLNSAAAIISRSI